MSYATSPALRKHPSFAKLNNKSLYQINPSIAARMRSLRRRHNQIVRVEASESRIRICQEAKRNAEQTSPVFIALVRDHPDQPWHGPMKE
jgi:hypothetical protein